MHGIFGASALVLVFGLTFFTSDIHGQQLQVVTGRGNVFVLDDGGTTDAKEGGRGRMCVPVPSPTMCGLGEAGQAPYCT